MPLDALLLTFFTAPFPCRKSFRLSIFCTNDGGEAAVDMQHLTFLGREVKKFLMELFMMLCILQNICTS